MYSLDDMKATTSSIPSDYVPRLKIGAGEIATIRFLSDYPDFRAAKFHTTVEWSSQTGKNVYRDILCTMDSEGKCGQCESGNIADKSKLHGWVYVYDILKIAPESADATPVQRGNRTYYKTPVNAVRLLRSGPGKSNYIVNALKKCFTKYGTLEDRDYEWSREGSKKDDTVYSLMPDDKGPFKVDKKSLTVMPIEDYIRKMFVRGEANPSISATNKLLDKLDQAATPKKFAGEPL